MAVLAALVAVGVGAFLRAQSASFLYQAELEQEGMLALVDAAGAAPGSRSPGTLEPGPGADA